MSSRGNGFLGVEVSAFIAAGEGGRKGGWEERGGTFPPRQNGLLVLYFLIDWRGGNFIVAWIARISRPSGMYG